MALVCGNCGDGTGGKCCEEPALLDDGVDVESPFPSFAECLGCMGLGPGSEWPCACGPTERALRAYIDQVGKCICETRPRPTDLVHRGGSDWQCPTCHAWFVPSLLPMTTEQREWCLDEIERCSEGSKREDYTSETDGALANSVLHAWLDFARDKGVI